MATVLSVTCSATCQATQRDVSVAGLRGYRPREAARGRRRGARARRLTSHSRAAARHSSTIERLTSAPGVVLQL